PRFPPRGRPHRRGLRHAESTDHGAHDPRRNVRLVRRPDSSPLIPARFENTRSCWDSRSSAAILKTAEAARLPWVRIHPLRTLACEQSSAHRFLHERTDACLCGGGELVQRAGDRPQAALVAFRRVAAAEGRVPRLELLCVLEEGGHLAVIVLGATAV